MSRGPRGGVAGDGASGLEGGMGSADMCPLPRRQ